MLRAPDPGDSDQLSVVLAPHVWGSGISWAHDGQLYIPFLTNLPRLPRSLPKAASDCSRDGIWWPVLRRRAAR
jgi:hypothetical protein